MHLQTIIYYHYPVWSGCECMWHPWLLLNPCQSWWVYLGFFCARQQEKLSTSRSFDNICLSLVNIMKGETGWNWMYSVDVQQCLFLCLGPECSILGLYYSDFLCSCIWTGWDLPKQRMWERRVLQLLGTMGDGKYFQLIPTCKNFLPFISLHEIPAQTFPMDLYKSAKWKISTKRDAFLGKARRDCNSQRSKCRVETAIIDHPLQAHEQNLWVEHELL